MFRRRYRKRLAGRKRTFKRRRPALRARRRGRRTTAKRGFRRRAALYPTMTTGGDHIWTGRVRTNRIYQGRTRKPKLGYISRGVGAGMPERLMYKHKYYTTMQVPTAVSASGVVNVFRLRSMFDPDLSFTGHQPRGRDQFVNAGYTYYSVHAASVAIRMAIDLTESSFPSGMFIVYLSGQTDYFTDQTEIMELGSTGSAMILGRMYVPAIQSTASSTGTQGGNLYVKKYVPNLWKLAQRYDYAGGSNPQTSEYFDYNQYTAVGNNPDVNTDVLLTCKSVGNVPATGSQGFEGEICITYYTEWYRQNPAAS